MSFHLSGDNSTVAIPLILQMLKCGSVSGTLTVNRNTIEKCIHFRDGQIIFATSNDRQERLGEILVREGMLTTQDLEAAVEIYKKHAGFKKIGAILVENRFVSPKDLFAGLKTQVKTIIYSLFLWEDAEYRFEEQISSDVIPLQINLQELIAEIIDRIKKES